jgi:uncharacterized protein
MKVVIAGASGFLGTAWTAHLEAAGHVVTRLVRREAGPGESQWDPYDGKVDLDVINEADVVANLAGATLVHFPWTEAYKRTFAASRVETTSTLAKAIAYSGRKPAFLAQNGIAGYGDRGDTVLTEADPCDADTFLGRLTVKWAAATAPAANAGARVVVMRTAVPLDKRGGALKPMLLPFRLGLGGSIGNGKQYFATISLHDWLRAITYLAESSTAQGAYNLTGPLPCTNAEYTKALARECRRPAFMRVPAWPIKKVLGPVAPELLGSVRLEPRRLLDEGFVFEHTTIEARIRSALR